MLINMAKHRYGQDVLCVNLMNYEFENVAFHITLEMKAN